MKSKISIIPIIILCLYFFAACSNNLERLQGKWEYRDSKGYILLQFKPNGNLYMEGSADGGYQAKGIYKLNDDMLFNYIQYEKFRNRGQKKAQWQSTSEKQYLQITFADDNNLILLVSNKNGEVNEKEQISLTRVLENK